MAQHFYHFRVRLLRFYTFYGSRHDSSRRVKILDGIILKRVKRLLSFFLFFIIFGIGFGNVSLVCHG